MAAVAALAAAAAVLAPIGANPSAAQSSSSGDGVVVIANGWSPPDVGAAAPLAGRLDAAVLYASKDELGQPTIDALEELDPERVLLMGGPAALTPAVQSQVRGVLSGATVERFSGDDRIDTAAKAALSEPAVPAGRTVVIANGWSPPDVGAAAPLAASLEGSVLFANENSLGAPTVAALGRLAPSRVVIVGGLAALGTDIHSQIKAIVPAAVIERLSGTDRIDTAALGTDLAGVAVGGPVVLANGWSAPDVGIAAPLAAALDGSVLLTERSGLGERTTQALEDFGPSQIILIGGSDRLAEAIDADLERLRRGIPRVNVVGANRIATAALAALLGVQLSAEQQRFEDAVATITPGEADCDAAPELDVAGVEVVDPPADLSDPATSLTVAEVIRIAGGCALVEYVALDGRTVAEVREVLTDRADVFAVGEPALGFEPDHDAGAHSGYGPGSGNHFNDGAGEQWHLPEQYMTELWKGWNPRNPITVAVIDSGTDATHPDLAGRVITDSLAGCHVQDSWDTDPALNRGGRLSPGGHGTHVAGIIAARADNGGIAGVAPDATILPFSFWGTWRHTETTVKADGSRVKTLHRGYRDCNPQQRGVPDPTPSVLTAIAEAINRGARVINMSFGARFTIAPDDDVCGAPDLSHYRRARISSSVVAELQNLIGAINPNCNAFHQILKMAQSITDSQGRPRGVVAVASAGNCGRSCSATDPKSLTKVGSVSNAFNLPAAYSSTIAVAAIDEAGHRADFSTAREYVEIAAPGVKILSTVPTAKLGDGDFEAWDGTSMAAPFVSGVVAHMLNRHPDAPPALVRRALTDTARYPGGLGSNTAQNKREYGHGIVQPREAILRLGELMDLNRTPNRISGLRVTGRTCPIGDDTPNCADPVVLALQPGFAAAAYPSQRRYSVEVPRDVDHVSVETDYDDNGRPGTISFHPPDSERRVAGHQFRFPTGDNEIKLKIWLPSWDGDRNANPYELTFRRTGNEFSRTVFSRELHICGLTERGKARCWGANDYGQSNPPGDTFVAIGAGEFHSCGIKTDGSLKCWGRDWHSQINPPAGRFEQIDLHWKHSCGIRPSGTVECWGENDHGKATPPQGVFIDIAVALENSCGIKADRTIACWGKNHFGQSDAPAGVFVEIEAGDDNHCAIRVDRTLACWGRDQRGQTSGHPPGTYQAVAPAWGHACAIRTDGTITCWGRNDHGESSPPGGIFVDITTGFYHSCGVRLGGQIECWGTNSHGQLDVPGGAW